MVRWAEGVVAQCRRTGYVETLFGRRRWLPNINARNWGRRAAAERQAVNTVCQVVGGAEWGEGRSA